MHDFRDVSKGLLWKKWSKRADCREIFHIALEWYFLYYTIMHFSASNKSQKITQYSVLSQSQKSATALVIIVASSAFTLLRVLALYRYSHIYYRLARKKKPCFPTQKKTRPRKNPKKNVDSEKTNWSNFSSFRDMFFPQITPLLKC